MRTPTRLMLVALLALGAPMVAAQDAPDEAAIKAVEDAWIAAWDAKDSAAIGALYTADADYHDAFGQRHDGRAAIEKVFGELIAGPYAGASLSMEPVSLNVVSPTLVVSESRWKMSGMPEGDGPTPPDSGLSTVVVVKSGDGWLIAAHRSRVPYTPPSP